VRPLALVLCLVLGNLAFASDAPEVAPVASGALEQRSLLVDLPSLVPSAPWPSAYRCFIEPLPPRLIVRRYHGPERLIFDRLEGILRQACLDSIRARIDRTSEPLPGIVSRVDRFYEGKADQAAGGRWWERTFDESLMPESGGAARGAVVVDVGQETDFLNLGGATLTNEGKLRWGKLDIFFGPTPPIVLDGSGTLALRQDIAPLLVPPGKSDGSQDATCDLERVLSGTPRAWRTGFGRVSARLEGNVLATDCWAIDCRPSINFSLPHGELYTIVQCAELDLDITYQPKEVAARWRVVFASMAVNPASKSAQILVGTEVIGF